jgi:hypothetical protein
MVPNIASYSTLQYCHAILIALANCNQRKQCAIFTYAVEIIGCVDNLLRGRRSCPNIRCQAFDWPVLYSLVVSQSVRLYLQTCLQIILWTFEFCSWRFNTVTLLCIKLQYVHVGCNLLEQSAGFDCNYICYMSISSILKWKTEGSSI